MTDKKTRAYVISLIISLICALFGAVGFSVDRYGELRPDAGCWLIFFAVLAVMEVLQLLMYRGCGRKQVQYPAEGTDDSGSAELTGRISFRTVYGKLIGVFCSRPAVWAVIFVCWLPVLLAEFPGFFVYDAVDEYVSVATRTFTTHHPLLHTLLLGGSVYAGEVMAGSANAGIFVYILVQMLFLSYIFSGIVCEMKHLRIVSLLFYGLFPTVVMFALCSAKDTLFAAGILCAVVLMRKLLEPGTASDKSINNSEIGPDSGDSGQRSKMTKSLRDYICLGLALTFSMLMRHNGIYACLVFAVVFTIYLLISRRTPEDRRSVYAFICVFACSFIGIFCINRTLEALTGADGSVTEHQEMLTVPIQQIARTYNAYDDVWSEDELEALYGYIPEEGLAHYTPELSDPVKMYFDNIVYEKDRSRFFELWFKGLEAHPLSYVNAWLCTSYGYWYPATVVNVYRGHTVYTFTYDESSYFGYEVEYPGERHSLIPFIDRFYRWLSLDDDIQRIPVIRLFFSMGACAWFFLCGMGFLLYKKRYDCFAAFLLPAFVWLTLLPGPTFLPRYTVFLFFLAPVMAGSILGDEDL